MKLLIYSYNYHPEPIGIAPLMTELAEGLVKRGHEVRVVTGMPNYPERQIYPPYQGKFHQRESVNGVLIDRCYVWVRPQPRLIDRILLDASFVLSSFFYAIAGTKPDLILLTVPPLPIAVPAKILAWFHQCPIVLNLQDILPDAAVQVGLLTNKSLIKVFEKLEKFSYATANKIAVIAEGFVDNLTTKQVSQDKITLIPNWVDTNFIQPLPKETNYYRIQLNLLDKFVILYSGNIALTQGLETVINAANHLLNLPNIVFLIVGETSAINQLQNYANSLSINNVIFLPFQPRQQLPTLLSAADIGLVLQKKNVVSFNMPSKIQVLLASGRPILASVPSNGTAAQAIISSAAGIVVPPENPKALANAIAQLYHNPTQIQELGQNARNYALNHYSFQKALNQYESLFQELLI